jgi:hypothetical protein
MNPAPGRKTPRLSVLVTGCSAGFGYRIARTLAGEGHRVFATMRDAAGRNREVGADRVPHWRGTDGGVQQRRERLCLHVGDVLGTLVLVDVGIARLDLDHLDPGAHDVGMGRGHHPAELLEEVDEVVGLDRETAGEAQAQREVDRERVLPGVPGRDDVGLEARVLAEQHVQEAVRHLRRASVPLEEEPAAVDLRLRPPGDPHHRIGAPGEVEAGREALHVLADRSRDVVVRVDEPDQVAAGEERFHVLPGMAVDVDLLVGERTILSYLTDRIFRVSEAAFRQG